MARHKHSETQTRYYSIVNGKFAQKAKEGTPGAVERFSEKKNAKVWEIIEEGLSGTIKSMTIDRQGKYGEDLIVTMDDVGESYTITIPVNSKYFRAFCSKIGNVNIKDEVLIAPFSFIPDGKDKSLAGLNFYHKDPQGEFKKKMEYYFTKEDPKGKPMPGEENLSKADFNKYKIDETEFFCKYIEAMKMDKPIERKATPTNQAPSTTSSSAIASTEAVDDLPF